MKKIGIVCVLGYCLFLNNFSWSQSSLTGVQILRTAQSIYDQGRLHELPTLLEQAFTDNKFGTQNEQVQAYRLLVLTYIYLEEPAKADENMLNLLDTDHFYKPNEASDPVEFQTLFRKFRSDPLFRIGLKMAVGQTFASAIENHYIAGSSAGYGVYSPNIGIGGILTFEKDLKGKFRDLIVNPEVVFIQQSFNYTNDNIFDQESPTTGEQGSPYVPAKAEHKYVHTRILLNCLVQYKLGTSRYTPYVTLGPSAGYLMSSSYDGVITFTQGRQKTGNVDNTENYKPINFSIIAGAGGKLKVGSIYLTADIRYQYGLGNIVDTKNRDANTEANNDLRFDYSYTNNDFSVSQAMVTFGIIYPYFNPKKLIK